MYCNDIISSCNFIERSGVPNATSSIGLMSYLFILFTCSSFSSMLPVKPEKFIIFQFLCFWPQKFSQYQRFYFYSLTLWLHLEPRKFFMWDMKSLEWNVLHYHILSNTVNLMEPTNNVLSIYLWLPTWSVIFLTVNHPIRYRWFNQCTSSLNAATNVFLCY